MSTSTTLALIDNWSMDGAEGVDGHFAWPVDIHAIVAEREEAASETPLRAPDHHMMKPAGEDDWRPLLVKRP